MSERLKTEIAELTQEMDGTWPILVSSWKLAEENTETAEAVARRHLAALYQRSDKERKLSASVIAELQERVDFLTAQVVAQAEKIDDTVDVREWGEIEAYVRNEAWVTLEQCKRRADDILCSFGEDEQYRARCARDIVCLCNSALEVKAEREKERSANNA